MADSSVGNTTNVETNNKLSGGKVFVSGLIGMLIEGFLINQSNQAQAAAQAYIASTNSHTFSFSNPAYQAAGIAQLELIGFAVLVILMFGITYFMYIRKGSNKPLPAYLFMFSCSGLLSIIGLIVGYLVLKDKKLA